jgi:curved DNA-binding protein CbpA
MDNKKKEDFYKLLNVSRNATPDDILKAFRHKSRVCHPDKNVGCEELMVQLTPAKITLLDTEKRAKYDNEYEGDDDLSEAEKLFLSSGTRTSENLKKKLSQWEKEFESTRIEDNFDSLSVKPDIVRSADSLRGIITNIYMLVNNIRDLNLDLLDEDAPEIKEKLELASLDKNYKRLNELLYGDNLRELAFFVKQNRCKKAIDLLHENYTKGRNIEEYPNKFKAALQLLQGSSLKISGKYNESLKHYEEAVLLCPSDDMCSAISLLLDSNYMESVAQNLLKHLNSVPKIPEKHEHVDTLKGNPNIRMTTRYEKSVLKNNQLNHFEKAMLYVDLSMAAVDSSVFANNYLIAATFLLQELETDCSLARKYSLRNLIFDLIVTVIFVAKRFEQPLILLYFMKFCYILMRKCHLFLREALKDRPANRLKRKIPLISELHTEMLITVEKEMIELVKVSPFTDLGLTLSADLIYLDVVTLQFLQNYYPERIKELKDHPWTHLYHYYQFELTWKTGGEEDILQTYRENLMNVLLDRKGWTQDEVEGLMGWEMINRDDDGWWDIKRPWLNIEGENYFRVAGVDVDIESGSFQLLLCKCPDGCAGINRCKIQPNHCIFFLRTLRNG